MYTVYATSCYVVVCMWCICCSHWKPSQISIQAICDLAVELAYSRSGLSQIEGVDALENEDTMKKTLSQGRFRHQYVGLFQAGSSAEGLAVQDTWGHEPADQDEMLLFGQRLCVHISHGFQSPDESLLIYRPEGCPPGYCKLEVIDTQALKQTSVWDQQLSASCILSSGNQHWLHTANTLIRIQQAKSAATPDSVYKSTYISGPTGQAASGLVEFVPTLVGNGPYPNLEEYRNRDRGDWPPSKLIDEVSQLPMLFVLIGHKDCSDSNLQARQSWSHCEFKLISGLPKHIIQGYTAFKYTMKTLLAFHRDQIEIEDGRSRIGSYHFKNVLLHHLENHSPSLTRSSFELILNLCRDLSCRIKNGKLPHYFLVECNLLETVDSTEQHLVQEVITDILSDPLSALLKSHAHPSQIYGDIGPSQFVTAFRQLSHNPISRRYQTRLLTLLAQIDLHRKLHHMLTLMVDLGGYQEYGAQWACWACRQFGANNS